MADVKSFDGLILFYDESFTTVLAYVPVFTVSSVTGSISGYFTPENYPIYEPRFPVNQIARTKADTSGRYFKAIPYGTTYTEFSAWYENGNIYSDYEFRPTSHNTDTKQAGPCFKKTTTGGYYISNYSYDIGSSSFNVIYSANNGPLYIDETPGPIPEPKTPVNFYIESPAPDYKAARGESVELKYIMVYDDGSYGPYTDVIYSDISFKNGGKQATLENNVITIAETCTASYVYFTAKPNIEGTELFATGYIEISNPLGIYDDGGTSGFGGSIGGGGGFGKNEVSDSIDIPSGSAAGDATSTGLLTRYLVNSSYLDAIGDWLWSTDLGLQIAKTVISAIYGNPAESVISLMSYPFNISTLSGVTSRNQNLVWGNHDSGIGAIALTSQAATVDWGTITLEEYWGNFLDYEPHTKIELYLPWGTGFVSIDPNMCLPGSIRVVTNIDFSKGSCIHNVIGNNNVVIGTYAGQCSQQIPIMSNDYASKMAGVVVSATALAVAGAAGGAATSAGIAAANSAYNLERSTSMPHSEKVARQTSAMQTAEAPHRAIQKTAARLAASSSAAAFKRSGIISRNGSFTDGSAALGVQYPYIILSRPSQSVPEQYGSHYGYPSNIYTRLNNVRGYTEVGEIHLDGIAGTDAEIAELDSILKGGVIF